MALIFMMYIAPILCLIDENAGFVTTTFAMMVIPLYIATVVGIFHYIHRNLKEKYKVKTE